MWHFWVCCVSGINTGIPNDILGLKCRTPFGGDLLAIVPKNVPVLGNGEGNFLIPKTDHASTGQSKLYVGKIQKLQEKEKVLKLHRDDRLQNTHLLVAFPGKSGLPYVGQSLHGWADVLNVILTTLVCISPKTTLYIYYSKPYSVRIPSFHLQKVWSVFWIWPSNINYDSLTPGYLHLKFLWWRLHMYMASDRTRPLSVLAHTLPAELGQMSQDGGPVTRTHIIYTISIYWITR